MLFVVESLARHDGFGTDGIRNSSLCREEIEQLHGVEHNVDRQKLGDP